LQKAVGKYLHVLIGVEMPVVSILGLQEAVGKYSKDHRTNRNLDVSILGLQEAVGKFRSSLCGGLAS